MTLRIGITGISGRMGKLLADEAAARAILSGGTSRSGAVQDGLPLFAAIEDLAKNSDVVIDFTHASAVSAHAAALAAAGTAWVLGTTGYGAAEEAAIAAAASRIPVLAAANFCAGVNILLVLAEQLAAALPAARYDAEILEMHHRQKVDAPSGTALAIGRAVAAGRGVELADAQVLSRAGHTGARRDGEIGFATLRGGQITGRHSLSFTAAEEEITLSHQSFDRRVYATGAVGAALWLHGRAPGLYGMRDCLGL